MLADRVRMCSGRKKKEVILKGNKPVGWCRSISDSKLSHLGASNVINIYGRAYRYLFMCFDFDTFPPIDSIESATLYVNGRKFEGSNDEGNRLRIKRYDYVIPKWTNSTGFPETSYDDKVINDIYYNLIFNTDRMWEYVNLTSGLKLMMEMNLNTLVLDSGHYNFTDDFFIYFYPGNEPYIDFTLK